MLITHADFIRMKLKKGIKKSLINTLYDENVLHDENKIYLPCSFFVSILSMNTEIYCGFGSLYT